MFEMQTNRAILYRGNGMKLSRLLNPFAKEEEDIFSEVYGHDNVKFLLNQSLRAPKPVHILMVSSPGMAKTKLMRAIEKKFKGKAPMYWALGSGATGQGMVQRCFDVKPRYLFIDEIEDLNQHAQASLLSLLEEGVLTETKIKNTREIRFQCTVFAACNNISKMKKRMLDRFVVIPIPDYTEEQFIKIATDVLRDKCSQAMSDFIIRNVLARKGDMRDCVHIASLCQNEADVLKYLETVK